MTKIFNDKIFSHDMTKTFLTTKKPIVKSVVTCE